ncbi:pentapeptide repeat-containing protein [Catellatospora vulcania]|uniref:pentapeptide repeat-containing protein n=1 Tax=Catellatospora vulcania TaxID=1460450 RepID=UPI0012D40847|nr:pentapeptide repeat-containing protein [Catellatospora vulcania]
MFDMLAPRPLLKPLRWWWVLASAVLVVGVGTTTGWWMWSLAHLAPAPNQAQNQALTQAAAQAEAQAEAEAIKTGLTAAGGTGAALALLLAVRRQRATELGLTLQDADLALRERSAAATEADAAESRITELYLKAVEQLGSDKAAVRLGAMYALERVAQDNAPHRQTVLDVMCAYLRMPVRPAYASAEDADAVGQNQEELEVRKAAQRIIRAHVQPRNEDKFWPQMRIELTGAYLVDFNLAGADVDLFEANHATFSGETGFHGARFGLFLAQGARFTEDRGRFGADFRGAHFDGDVYLAYSWFEGTPWFHTDRLFPAAVFENTASFKGVHFKRGARFEGCAFKSAVDFEEISAVVGPDDQASWPDGWAYHDGTLVRQRDGRDDRALDTPVLQ